MHPLYHARNEIPHARHWAAVATMLAAGEKMQRTRSLRSLTGWLACLLCVAGLDAVDAAQRINGVLFRPTVMALSTPSSPGLPAPSPRLARSRASIPILSADGGSSRSASNVADKVDAASAATSTPVQSVPTSMTTMGIVSPLRTSTQSQLASSPASDVGTSVTSSEDVAYTPIAMEDLQDDVPQTLGFALVSAYLFGGVLFYSQALDWSLLDSLYFVIVTLTSVGYGDLVPADASVRLFTVGYILLGVGIIGTVLGELVSTMLNVDATPMGRIIRWLSGFGGQNETGDEKSEGTGGEEPPTDAASLLASGDARARLTSSLLAVSGMIGVGTVSFAKLEGLDLVDALYYSVVTVSTVGYGDFTPSTEAGKAFACVYALVGAILVARSLGSIAALPLEARRRAMQRSVLEQYGGELDAEELDDLVAATSALQVSEADGSCSKSAFTLAMLVRQDKVTEEDIAECLRTFEQLDVDGSGRLDQEDVELWVRKLRAEATSNTD
uniref:EF-hand domain-containing protein n=1 Tax=Chrysotila carterae TaxID=13221 RepID=A0A7S4B6I4_CHRCT